MKKLNLMWSRTKLLIGCLLFIIFYLPGCDNEPEQTNTRKTKDYIKQIPGKNDTIPAKVAERGEVLIGYSDSTIVIKSTKDRLDRLLKI